MKGIIIGAGRGRRLMPYTSEQPKCFAELAGRRILDWVLAAMRRGGIGDIVFVGGYRIDDVRGSYPDLRFRHNDEWEQNNILASLLYAAPDMDHGFVSSYSDIVYVSDAVSGVIGHPGDIVLAVDTHWRDRYTARTEHPESDGEKVRAAGDRVLEVSRDIASDDALGEFIGVAKFSPRGASLLREGVARLVAERGWEAPMPSGRPLRKAYLIEFIQQLIEHGVEVNVATIPGGYFEIDTTQDYQLARDAWPRILASRGGEP